MDDNIRLSEEPSQEELEVAQKKFIKLMHWSQSLTAEQIAFLCDGGWYNNTIRGYAVIAAENAGFTSEQIRKLLDGFHSAFDDNDKVQAEMAEIQFLKRSE